MESTITNESQQQSHALERKTTEATGELSQILALDNTLSVTPNINWIVST